MTALAASVMEKLTVPPFAGPVLLVTEAVRPIENAAAPKTRDEAGTLTTVFVPEIVRVEVPVLVFRLAVPL